MANFKKVKVQYVMPNACFSPAPKAVGPMGVQLPPVTVPIPVVPYMGESPLATYGDEEYDEY